MQKKRDTAPPSCDWTPKRNKLGSEKPSPRTRLYRHRPDYSWTGVTTEKYKSPDGTWSDVLRRTLVGRRGERTKFHLRYFEVSPGGHTTLERHRHEHVVVGVRGRGRCRVGKRTCEVGFMDTLYVPPGAEHQLKNPFKEPFGFFCIVDARRDRPRPVNK